jgi:CubicO group peptidase (beta-lactamase class C family)
MSLRERIHEIVEAYRVEHDIPGAAIAVVQDGAITLEEGYGTANLETGAPPTPHTLWPIASLTKSFTGVAAMQLVEQGRLLLDEPIQSYLPEFRFADPEASRKITMRNLLLHAGGIGRSGHQDTLREISDEAYPTRQQLVAALTTAVQQSAPNTAWSYSNEGYATAGHTMETAAGEPLEDLFQHGIFDRVGMSNSHPRFRNWREAEDRAIPYGREHVGPFDSGEQHGAYTVIRLPRDYQPFLATGGTTSTAHDLALYQIATMRYGDSHLLSAGSLDSAHSAQLQYGDTGWGYGLGYQVMWTADSTRVIGHSGGLPGVSNYSLMVPADQAGVVVLTNRNDRTGMNLAELVMNEVRDEPLFRPTLADPLPLDSSFEPDPAALEACAGIYEFRMGPATVEVNERGVTVVTPSRYDAHEVRMVTLAVAPDVFLGQFGGEPIYFMRNNAGSIRGFTHMGYYYPRAG